MNRKIDKRTIETKQKIKEAVINQLQNHQSDEITVTEITSICNINRNTFYIHFSSIADVLNEIEKELNTTIIEAISRHTVTEYMKNPQLIIGIIARIFVTSKNYGGLIFESNFSKYLTSSIIKSITDYLFSSYQSMSKGECNQGSYFAIEFLVGGFFFTLKDWYLNRRGVTLEEFVDKINNVIRNGVSNLFENIFTYSKIY